MGQRIDYRYSLRVFMGLLLTLGPGLAAWFNGGTLDRYPRWLLLFFGVVVSGVFLARRLKRRAGRGLAAPSSVPSYPEARAPFQMILSLLGPPCWCLALGLFGNQLLDAAPPTVYGARYISYHRPPKTAAVVTVTSWRTPGERETLRFDPATFVGVGWDTPSGTAVEVYVKPGFFGWEWVLGMRPARRK